MCFMCWKLEFLSSCLVVINVGKIVPVRAGSWSAKTKLSIARSSIRGFQPPRAEACEELDETVWFIQFLTSTYRSEQGPVALAEPVFWTLVVILVYKYITPYYSYNFILKCYKIIFILVLKFSFWSIKNPLHRNCILCNELISLFVFI